MKQLFTACLHFIVYFKKKESSLLVTFLFVNRANFLYEYTLESFQSNNKQYVLYVNVYFVKNVEIF
jgi:hypothetical protein